MDTMNESRFIHRRVLGIRNSLSFIETSVVEEHAIPQAVVGDVTGSHFVLVRIYDAVLVGGIAVVPDVIPAFIEVLRPCLLARHLALLIVRLVVEVAEEEVEHYGVHADPPDEGLRVVAVDEEQLERMYHHQDELDHL